jgi:methyl-accepting chemotaxis protein
MLTWFGNIKMSCKLMLGFAVMGVIMAGLGWVAGQGLMAIRESLRVVYEDYTVAGTVLAHASTDLMRYRNNIVQATGAPDQATYAKLNDQQPELKAKTLKSLETYAATVLRVSKSGRDEVKDLQALREAITAYYPAAELSMSLAGNIWAAQSKQDADAMREKAKANVTQNAGPKLIATINALDRLLGTVSEVAKDMNEEGRATAANALLTLAIGTVVAIAIGLLLGWLIARFLSRNLADVIMAAQALGGGNLSARSSVATQDEVGTLAQSFNEMGAQLQAKVTKEREQAAKMEQFMVDAKRVLGALAQSDLTDQVTNAYEGDLDQIKSSLNSAMQTLICTFTAVREAAESVATGSEQISQGTKDLSQRTNEQTASLEETSSAMEEITATVKQSADNAKQANQLAIAARDVANKGGAVTTKAVEAMGEINESSKKIADIITVIDEIAFQTNLLALNAAVEAARAGEHGRGFAVVAAEVRNLAQRSATAAKEIKGLIHESIQRVTDGSELVHQSGKTLEEIVGSVKRVTDIIAEITAASQEQAGGINQVSRAIMQMDETTQQNAALVEEVANASQCMRDQAKELMDQIACFKINLSEENKAAMPAVAHLRKETARTLHHVFGKPEPGAVPSPKPAFTAMGRKSVAPSKAEIRREPAGAGIGLSAVMQAGNGKDRRQKDSEFEEF